jgi:phosphatidylserine/phosphatidylglycerophosphate/cardiolipin synthase-like enzyme
MTNYITDREIYDRVVLQSIPQAKKFLWISTSDLKDMYVEKRGGMAPFLEILSDLIEENVSVRLIHAREVGKNFRDDFDRYPNLIQGLERILCPRAHFKSVIVDGRVAYTGSANLTGAGMGAKAASRRNFESGFITDERALIKQIMEQFDAIWMGLRCGDCQRKEFCADYKDILLK